MSPRSSSLAPSLSSSPDPVALLAALADARDGDHLAALRVAQAVLVELVGVPGVELADVATTVGSLSLELELHLRPGPVSPTTLAALDAWSASRRSLCSSLAARVVAVTTESAELNDEAVRALSETIRELEASTPDLPAGALLAAIGRGTRAQSVVTGAALPWFDQKLSASRRIEALIAETRTRSVDERIVLAGRVASSVLSHEIARLGGVDLADVRDVLGEIALEEAIIRDDVTQPDGTGGSRLNAVGLIRHSATRSACRELAATLNTTLVDNSFSVREALIGLQAACYALEVGLPVRERGDLLDMLARATMTIDADALDEIAATFGRADAA